MLTPRRKARTVLDRLLAAILRRINDWLLQSYPVTGWAADDEQFE